MSGCFQGENETFWPRDAVPDGADVFLESSGDVAVSPNKPSHLVSAKKITVVLHLPPGTKHSIFVADSIEIAGRVKPRTIIDGMLLARLRLLARL